MNPKERGLVDLGDLPETDWIYFNKRGLTKEILDSIISKRSLIRMCFSNEKKIIDGKEHFIYEIVYPNFLGKILYYAFEIPRGKRVYTNPGLPNFIFKNKKFLGYFMGRIFANEGHKSSSGCGVTHSSDITKTVSLIGFEKVKLKKYLSENNFETAPKLLWAYQRIFYILGCKKPSEPYIANFYTTSKKEFRAKWQIYIGGEDVKILLKKVNLDNDLRESLEDYVNSIKFFRFPKQMRIDQILKLGNDFQKQKGHFTTRDIIKKTGLDKSGINRNIKLIEQKGLIGREFINGRYHFHLKQK